MEEKQNQLFLQKEGESIMMYLSLGIAAIVTAIINLILTVQCKETKWFRFCSMSFTALTMCAFYSDAARMVLEQDWSELMDVLPTISKVLWVCVGTSILLNGISLIRRRNLSGK